jgi:serine/threonine protein phosphatase PrpC
MSNWIQLTPSIYHRLALGSAYGMTDVGPVRASNEDNFLIDPELGLVVIGDGMGGHDGGEIASHSAITSLRDFIAQSEREHANGKPRPVPAPDAHDPDATWQDQHMPAVLTVFEAVEFANAEVYGANLRNAHGEGGGMGTTLTGFWHSGNSGPLIVFHVGDSRLYRYRAGELNVLTRDQTLYQQALEEGVSDSFPPRNLLLQAIGPTESVAPDVKTCAHQPGDLYMLCSDGLYGNTPHAALAEVMAGATAQTLDQCCADLIELAKTHGSRDNITAVLVLCEG